MRSFRLLVALLLGGCSQAAPVPAPPVAPGPAAASPAVSTSASDPRDQAEAMDTRTPVPLTPMMATHQKEQMRDHLVAVDEIVTALATDDWPTMQSAAARLGSSPENTMMCEHMGAATPGFTGRGLEFHHTADALSTAAQAQDHAGVVKALAATLSACTKCHADFRQDIVTGPEFAVATGTPPPTHPAAPATP